MFSSFFSAPIDPTAQNFHPVSDRFGPSDLFGPLEPKDTEWTCAGGFVTETQIFYNFTEDGTTVMVQVIHSSVGLWPQIQLTARIYDPNTKETTWKSVNVSNFVTPIPGLDKRSSKSDQFTITHKTNSSDHPESYSIIANYGDDLKISLEAARPAAIPGYKIGQGAKGGFSYFGPDAEKPEGYVIHRFWPRFKATGHIIRNGQATEFKGPGMFVHAIQGMRPNLVAASWNFAHFQSDLYDGVSAIQMEFTTIDAYGKRGAGSGFAKVNVGSVVVGGKLATVTAQTTWPGEDQKEGVVSKATHAHQVLDPDTGYQQPAEITFEWSGPSVVSGSEGTVEAKVVVNVGPPSAPNGLIEKVDVLAEIPTFVKAVVSYVAGTKPYIYQWVNPATLVIKGPDSLVPGLSGGLEVEGRLYNEATFIS